MPRKLTSSSAPAPSTPGSELPSNLDQPSLEAIRENFAASCARAEDVKKIAGQPAFSKTKYSRLVAELPPGQSFSVRELVTRWSTRGGVHEKILLEQSVKRLVDRGLLIKTPDHRYRANDAVYALFTTSVAPLTSWAAGNALRATIATFEKRSFEDVMAQIEREWATIRENLMPVASPYSDSERDQGILFTVALRQHTAGLIGSYWHPRIPNWAVVEIFKTKIAMSPDAFARMARGHLERAFVTRIKTALSEEATSALGVAQPSDSYSRGALAQVVAKLYLCPESASVLQEAALMLKVSPDKLQQVVNPVLVRAQLRLLSELEGSPLRRTFHKDLYSFIHKHLLERKSVREIAAAQLTPISDKRVYDLIDSFASIDPIISYILHEKET